MNIKEAFKDKSVRGHALVGSAVVVVATALGKILSLTGITLTLGQAVVLMLAFGVTCVYYGREVDQEQQKLVFDKTLKDPEVTMHTVGLQKLVPWKWQSWAQRWDLYSVGIAAGVLGVIGMLLCS